MSSFSMAVKPVIEHPSHPIEEDAVDLTQTSHISRPSREPGAVDKDTVYCTTNFCSVSDDSTQLFVVVTAVLSDEFGYCTAQDGYQRVFRLVVVASFSFDGLEGIFDDLGPGRVQESCRRVLGCFRLAIPTPAILSTITEQLSALLTNGFSNIRYAFNYVVPTGLSASTLDLSFGSVPLNVGLALGRSNVCLCDGHCVPRTVRGVFTLIEAMDVNNMYRECWLSAGNCLVSGRCLYLRGPRRNLNTPFSSTEMKDEILSSKPIYIAPAVFLGFRTMCRLSFRPAKPDDSHVKEQLTRYRKHSLKIGLLHVCLHPRACCASLLLLQCYNGTGSIIGSVPVNVDPAPCWVEWLSMCSSPRLLSNIRERRTLDATTRAGSTPCEEVHIRASKPAPDPLNTLNLVSLIPPELAITPRALRKKSLVTWLRSVEDLKASWLGQTELMRTVLPVWMHHLPSLLTHPSRRLRVLAGDVQRT
ncbi:hypothetical protein BDZ89DRAFT_1138594 [Hymenopellis radicata]|nr:hypothetical protein BDZ89DRAFT_1138594 [Hymenopellis radicata]